MCATTSMNTNFEQRTIASQPSPAVLLQQPQPSIACVGLLYDIASNRTFRIPDVPATSSVSHIKQWYSKNVTACDPRQLQVLHNSKPVEDGVQVWQLAQGQGQFAISVTQTKSPRTMLSLYVDTALNISAIPLSISNESSILYVKMRLFEILNLPMAYASKADTAITLGTSTVPLQNESTLADCNVLNNARLSLAFSPDALTGGTSSPELTPAPLPSVAQFQPAPPGFDPQPQYTRIKEIWGDGSKEVLASSLSPTHSPTTQVAAPKQATADHSFLPAMLFEEEEEEGPLSSFIGAPMIPVPLPVENQNHYVKHQGAQSQTMMPNRHHYQNHLQQLNGATQKLPEKSRGRRSRSPPGTDASELSRDQLQHLAQNFRTKLCRNGSSCKFGRNCWFAHNDQELRRPSDPLPNNLPAVNKLERYSQREANAAKDRSN